MRITRKAICDAIKNKTGISVSMFKVKDDYFYFYSDDKDTNLMLSSKESASVYTNRLGTMTIIQWVKEFEEIIKER